MTGKEAVERILLSHGGGGKLARELLERLERAERMLELLEAAGHVSPETMNQTHNIVRASSLRFNGRG